MVQWKTTQKPINGSYKCSKYTTCCLILNLGTVCIYVCAYIYTEWDFFQEFTFPNYLSIYSQKYVHILIDHSFGTVLNYFKYSKNNIVRVISQIFC